MTAYTQAANGATSNGDRRSSNTSPLPRGFSTATDAARSNGRCRLCRTLPSRTASWARLNAAVTAALATPELRTRLGTFGMDIRGSTPAEAVAFVRAETVKWTNAIRQAGIEPE